MADLNQTVAPLSTIISWFAEDAVPTDTQFETTWKSFFHKSENIPVEQIYQLAEILNLKAERDHMHFDLAKKDGSNLSVEDINGLKEVLGVALAANGIINNIETTITSEDANALQDGIYKPKTTGVFTAIGLTAKDNYTTLFKKLDGVWSMFSEEAIPMQDLTEIEQNTLTYKVTTNNINTDNFKKYIKNIYISSSINIKKLTYFSINDNVNRKLLLQFEDDNTNIGTFIIESGDLRVLRNNTVELIFKEDSEVVTNSTRVFVEFYDLDFPSINEVSFLIHNDTDEIDLIIQPYTPYESTYNNLRSGVLNATAVKIKKIIKDIFIVDPKKQYNTSNVELTNIFINQYNGLNKIIIQLEINDTTHTFKRQDVVNSNDTNVLLNIKETNLDIDVYVNIGEFTEEVLTLSTFKWYFELTEESFKNDILIQSKRISIIEGDLSKKIQINTDKSNGNNAVQLALNSITDASANKRYNINVSNGLYEIHKPSDFIGNPSYPAMICPKNYVDITGEDKVNTILSADFDEDTGNTPIDMYQTIYNWANESTISNITFISKNLRYTLHQDSHNEANGTRYYNNCDFIFKGNKGYNMTLGIGTYSGSKTYINGGRTESQDGNAFSVHNNVNFAKASLWHFSNHSFEVLENKPIINLINSGSNQNCEVIFNDCEFLGNFVINYSDGWLYQQNINDHFNHANFSVKGNGNSPFYFKNTAYSVTLCIETISKTKDSKVRFDVNSSAYPILIQNHINNYFGNLGNPNRNIKDDYVIQDGANGISGFAFGGKSILEGFYNLDVSWLKRESFDSLGLRLGDCSSANKVLGIIINGVTYNITFNKNYTAFTNAQIIAEINAVIGSVATAKEYNLSKDYYAEMTDVVMIGVNNSTTDIIPKGTLVTKIGNRIAPCGENDKLYGLLIDDLGAYELDNQGVVTSKARVIRNCYVSIDNGNVSSALHDSISSRYKIVNGRFVADVNGQYRAIDNKYILI